MGCPSAAGSFHGLEMRKSSEVERDVVEQQRGDGLVDLDDEPQRGGDPGPERAGHDARRRASRPAAGRHGDAHRGEPQRRTGRATAPMISCPSPPTLTSPARAGTTTASAASAMRRHRMHDLLELPRLREGRRPDVGVDGERVGALGQQRTRRRPRVPRRARRPSRSTGSHRLGAGQGRSARRRRTGRGAGEAAPSATSLAHAAPPSISRPMDIRSAPAVSTTPDEVAVVHDGDPVGHGDQLVEVLRDHEHPGARGAVLQQQLLRAAGVGDVEPPARVGRDDERGVLAELAGEQDALDVAARQRRDCGPLAAPCAGRARSSSTAVRRPTAGQSIPSPRRGTGRPSSTMCSSTVRPGTTESATGSSGTPTAPASSAPAGVRTSCAADPDRAAACDRPQPERDLAQLALAAAGDARRRRPARPGGPRGRRP